MAMPRLLGYRFSVYHRIARLVLHEKDVPYQVEDVDPFSSDAPETYLKRHPFGRVPVLSHGDFDIYETAAIARYVDATFNGPALTPTQPKALARMAQVIAIIDNYGYDPMVRQVFAHRVFRPAIREHVDESIVLAGLAASHKVLGALNDIAAEGYVLNTQKVTLAECHLAPMLAYFVQAPEGADALCSYDALADWWSAASQWASLADTDPGLSRKRD